MSRSPVRKDKTCLNCSHVVDQRFCPNCGQENTETRKTFHHLFVHFFEDLTHYENAFWKTIRNLLFKPGSLTRVYLSGKRMSYLAPIRLYIFISFVTFFLFTILPTNEDGAATADGKTHNTLNVTTSKNAKASDTWKSKNDSIAKMVDSLKAKQRLSEEKFALLGFSSIRELDSIQKFGAEDDKLPNWLYYSVRKGFGVTEKYSNKEIFEKFRESFARNFPKVLFIYMPMFAFVLWIFYSKKRWYYFDHGIFTLHYFSFLLLMSLIARMFVCIFGYLEDWLVFEILNGIIGFAIFVYMMYYFFPSLHRFYGESRIITVIKGAFMMFINITLAGILMLAFIIYTFINIH